MRVLYAQAVYGQQEIDAVVDVLKNRSHALMTGEAVGQFEERVAELFGKKYGLMVNSGSSANTLAVSCLGLPERSEVITPALTFSTTVAPLVQNKLIPAFIDVEPDTYNIDVTKIESLISSKTRAMLVPNLIGNLPDWEALRDIANRYNLILIEDSADTIGSLYNGVPTGALSDISTTSFYASHVVTAAGFGGAVCFNDPALERKARLLRGWGRSSSVTGESESIEDRFSVSIEETPYDSKFLFEAPGYNFLPSEISAAFGLVQLQKLKEYTKIRMRNFNTLVTFFKEYEKWFILPRQNPACTTPWLAVPLIVRDDAPFSRRDLQIHFEERGIQTRTVFTGNILRQPGFRDIHCIKSDSGYPNADQVMRGGILLGCHQGMSEEQAAYICEQFVGLADRF